MHTLLASNMRLHESVLQLMDQAASAAAAAKAAKAASGRASRQYQRPTLASLGRGPQQPAVAGWKPAAGRVLNGWAGPSAVGHVSGYYGIEEVRCSAPGAASCPVQLEAPAQATRSPGGSRMGSAALFSGAAGCDVASAGSITPAGPAEQAARASAVHAALAISTEYRELHEYYKASCMRLASTAGLALPSL